jgi:hypothetical protein
MIDPASPYAEAAQALQRGCRDEAERVAHIVFLSVPRARRDLFTAPPHAGVMTGGQPEVSGLASAVLRPIRDDHA